MNLDDIVLRNVMSVEEAELVHNNNNNNNNNNPSSSPPASAAATASLFLGKRAGDVEPQPDLMTEVSASTEGMEWMHYQRALLIDSKLPASQAVYNNHGSVPDIGVYNLQAMSITTSASSNSDFHEGNYEQNWKLCGSSVQLPNSVQLLSDHSRIMSRTQLD